jgi:O-antigen/teichoic acid export membrane protein
MPENAKSPAIQGLARNVGIMSAGRLVADIFTFIFYVALSREYGATALGHYAIAMALTGFGVFFSVFGLHPLALREIGKDPGCLGHFGPRIIGLGLCLSLLTYSGIALLALAFIRDEQFLAAVLLIGLFQIIWHFGMGLGAIFTAMGESHLNSMLEIGQRVLMAGAGFLAIICGASFAQTLWVMPGASLAHAGLALLILNSRYKLSGPQLDWHFSISVLRRSASFAQAGLMQRLQSRLDILAVGFFAGSVAAGIYNAAHRIIFLVGQIVANGGMALLPAAARIAKDDALRFARFFQDMLAWAIVMGVPLSVGLLLTASDTILFLYGEEFQGAGLIMMILAPMAVLMLVRQVFASGLQAIDMERKWARLWASSTVMTALAMAVLVPKYGASGAAIGIVLTQVIFVAQCGVVLFKKGLLPFDTHAFFLGTLGSISMTVLLQVGSQLHLPAKVLLGVAAYVGTLSLFPSARKRFIKPLIWQATTRLR